MVSTSSSTLLTEGDSSPLADCGVGYTTIVDEPTVANGEVDLNAILVSEYLAKLPRDPSSSTGSNTGYSICKLTTPTRYEVAALGAELSEVIKIPPSAEYAQIVDPPIICRVGATGGTLTNGLIGYWAMNQASWNGTPDEVIDSSGSGNHGRADGGPNTVSDCLDRAAEIGLNGGIDVGDLTPSTGRISIAGWINIDDTFDGQSFHPILTRIEGDPPGGITFRDNFYNFNLSGTTEKYLVFRYRGADCIPLNQYLSVENTLPIEPGEWHHVAVTFNVIDVKFYVDGQNVSTFQPGGGNICTGSNENTSIGEEAGATSYSFDGRIDELRLYDRALTPAEVADLYEL